MPVRLDDPRGGRRPGGDRDGSGSQRNNGNRAPDPRGGRQQPEEPWHPGAARYARDPRRDQPSLRGPAPRSREYEYETPEYETPQYDNREYDSREYEYDNREYEPQDTRRPPEPQAWGTGPPETRPQGALIDGQEDFREPRTSRAKVGKTKADKVRGLESTDEQRTLSAKTAARPIKAREQVVDTRSGRRRRRIKVVPAVAVTSAVVVLVTLGTAAYYKIGPGAPNGSGAAAAFNALTNSKALGALEAERQQIVAMNAATQVMTTTSKPLTASVSQATSDSAESTASDVGVADSASPAEAQEIAQELMPSYGFSVADQFSCLYDIWERESGWQWDAENTASGAYGIPQSLPASKMDMFGSDYLTDATTQIKWGLWYIQNRYGTPCAAWDFELDNGFY